MVLNRAQGLKEKSHEVSVRKNNNRLRYNKIVEGGGFCPPALLGLSFYSESHYIQMAFFWTVVIRNGISILKGGYSIRSLFQNLEY